MMLPQSTTPHVERSNHTTPIEVGQWYWVKDWNHPHDEDGKVQEPVEYHWLGCVTMIGSNFVKISAPRAPDSGSSYVRIHMDEFLERTRLETNAHDVIQEKISQYQALITAHMGEVKAITARLGISSQTAIEHKPQGSGQALATLSGQSDVKGYERSLIRAEKEDLPALFESIKKAGHKLSKWMSAESLPLESIIDSLQGTLDAVKDRIFTVSLYAGLTEQVVRCADGSPADFNARLHLMQRRLYCDEECLLNYSHGGMEFKNMGEFDEWLVRPENCDRILPFPRCIVSMRVRRSTKEREWDETLRTIIFNFEREELDKTTFLYIRNGDQVYRMNCTLEFGELIFPDKSMFDPGEPMMVKMFAESVDKLMTVREYEDRVRVIKERKQKSKQWCRENPRKKWEAENPGLSWDYSNPYREEYSFNQNDWEPFDDTNVFYDECVQEIADRIKQYNRIALIIQGLLDRSEILHPHPPARTWTPEGFAAAIELVYDGSAVLHHGGAPDFEKYRAHCNESLAEGSIVVGQDHYWQVREAEKESRRLDMDWRSRSAYRPTLFRPYGNPGPGYIARVEKWHPHTRSATFAWKREGRRGTSMPTSLTVPADSLFNVSAYRLGDYKQFFRDPRTRANYLQWAPMLIEAEEYHAGNRKLKDR